VLYGEAAPTARRLGEAAAYPMESGLQAALPEHHDEHDHDNARDHASYNTAGGNRRQPVVRMSADENPSAGAAHIQSSYRDWT